MTAVVDDPFAQTKFKFENTEPEISQNSMMGSLGVQQVTVGAASDSDGLILVGLPFQGTSYPVITRNALQ